MSTVKFPSATMFRYESRQLLKDIERGRPEAVIRAIKNGLKKSGKPTLTDCAIALANEYGMDYKYLSKTHSLFRRYFFHNVNHGFWEADSVWGWRPKRFHQQLLTILKASELKIPLQEMARRDQQSFVGFHFSEELFHKIFCILDGWPYVNFTGLIAHDALIHEQWMGGPFAHAKLSRAKFYRTYVDPAISPGVVAADTDFSNADLSGADLRLSYIARCDFTGAMLEGTDLRGA